jgi:hypothetical protein
VPDGEATVHANGVTGVAGVTVVVRDIQAASEDFAALTGSGGVDVEPVVHDIAAARRFPVGSGWIEAVQPSERESELRTYLETRGELPYEVTLVSPSASGALIDEGKTHGARLLVIADAGVLA